jgi:DNA processing protein
MDSELRDLLTLHLVPGLGPRLTAALLARFGSAAGVLRASAAELREVPHIGPKLANAIVKAIQEADVNAELERLARFETRLLLLGSPEYPSSLAEIPDPPHLLYVRGQILPSDSRAVALVGSRQFTPYGRRVAERLATGLARAGWTVVSGLARGIDGAAHRAALDAGGRTIAVLAGGLTRIYPPEHADLAQATATSGALISESAMTQEPIAGLFPGRNRLISGLSRGVVVVEAAAQSGTLITARHAGDQGRSVFAVPGPIDSPSSAGTHQLIRNGAVLVRDVDDILQELATQPVATSVSTTTLPAESTPMPPPAIEPPPGLDGVRRAIWDFLAHGQQHADNIGQQVGLPAAQIAGLLLEMEMARLVRRLPGNQYEQR